MHFTAVLSGINQFSKFINAKTKITPELNSSPSHWRYSPSNEHGETIDFAPCPFNGQNL
jgi:hypothetical protein